MRYCPSSTPLKSILLDVLPFAVMKLRKPVLSNGTASRRANEAQATSSSRLFDTPILVESVSSYVVSILQLLLDYGSKAARWTLQRRTC